MPPKRNVKKRVTIKQKREIISRLMQISFKVDDYIYKEVSITTNEAQNLLQEIHSFKESCHDDERSMQVIEKLTRLLQTIVEEQGQNGTDINKNNSPNNIYDITDANRSTLLTRTTITSLDLDVSQGTSHSEILQTKDAYKEHQVESLPSNIENFSSNIQETSTTKDRFENKEIVIENPDLDKVSNITQEKIENHFPGEITNEYNTRSVKEIKKPRRFEKPEDDSKKLNKVTRKQCSKMKTFGSRNKRTQLTKSVGNSKTLNENTHQLTQSFNVSPKPNQSKSKKVPKTEIDLSWIENIKYVREINPEEFDPKHKDISESFWQNCIFPRDWDDDDFLLN